MKKSQWQRMKDKAEQLRRKAMSSGKPIMVVVQKKEELTPWIKTPEEFPNNGTRDSYKFVRFESGRVAFIQAYDMTCNHKSLVNHYKDNAQADWPVSRQLRKEI